MRYPTEYALAMRCMLDNERIVREDECLVLRQRDISWKKHPTPRGQKWGVTQLGEERVLYIAIPILHDDLCGPYPNEYLRRVAAGFYEKGATIPPYPSNSWVRTLTLPSASVLLPRLNMVRHETGLSFGQRKLPFMLDKRGSIVTSKVDGQMVARFTQPNPEEEPQPAPVPVPAPEPQPKKRLKKKDMPEITEAKAGETGTKDPQVVIRLDGVSPLGQAIWPSIEPILEARLNVLRGEVLARGLSNITVSIPDRPKVELEGEHLHPAVMEALAAVGRGEDLFLVGPPGSGKTYMAEQLAKLLGYETAMISFNEQTMSSDLFGRYIVNEKGGMDWHDGPVPAAFRTGKTVIIMDEVDRANPNTVDGLNSAIANRRCNLPQRRETLRSQEVVFVACANAYAADAQNTSSNTLAASFYDRFWRMEIGYDKGLEERFLAFNMPLLTKLWAIRDAVVEHKLRRHVSTRFVIRAAKASKAGMKNDDILKQLVLGWRKEEKDKLKNLLPGGA